jgi:hypothetical protein
VALEQVWVQPSRRVQLLEFHSPGAVAPAVNPDKDALALLRAVAVLALEGPGAAGANCCERIRAVVPLHARRLLERLSGIKDPYERLADVQADLAATRDRPTEVTPVLRALHLATSFCFLAVGLFAMLAWGRAATVGMILALDHMVVRAQVLRHVLDHDDLREAFFAELPPGHTLRTHTEDYPDLLEGRVTQARHEARDRIDGLGVVGSAYLVIPAVRARGSRGDADEPLRMERRPGKPFTLVVTRLDLPDDMPLVLGSYHLERTAAWAAEGTDTDFERSAWAVYGSVLLMVSFFPALWVVWAFIFRGGLGLRVAGLALVRSSGKDALRVQCAWRAFVVWAPLLVPLLVIVWLDAHDPGMAWLCVVLQGLCALVLVGYAALALRFRRRCLHDWLAGTYLVPR